MEIPFTIPGRYREWFGLFDFENLRGTAQLPAKTYLTTERLNQFVNT
jgi:hypothetical protein